MNIFNAETHTYTISGMVVPSVTQVLNDLIPCYQAGEWYINRGTAVHACAAMIARGQEFEHDPQIDGQVKACRKFFCETGFCCLESEWQLFSKKHGFAGTMDALGGIGSQIVVLDWKSSFAYSLPYQLAAYSILIEESGCVVKANHGIGVQLNEDGTYQMSEMFDLRRYRQGFLSLLNAYKIRRECKVKQEGTKE